MPPILHLIPALLAVGLLTLQLLLCFRSTRIFPRLIPVIVLAVILILYGVSALLAVTIQDMIPGLIGLVLLYSFLYSTPLIATAWIAWFAVRAVRNGKGKRNQQM